jgi:hypothetical protein
MQLDIDAIVKDITDTYRKAKKAKKDPEFSFEYVESVELMQRVKPHAYDRVFPDELFAKRAPNESIEEFRYRKDLFKAIGSITNPYWEKALGKVNRIWNDKNYYLKFKPMEGVSDADNPENYFFRDIPYCDSIESYFREIVTTQKINDPNAVLAIDITEYSDNQLPTPYPVIYNSKQVWGYEVDKYLVVKTNEKSIVKYGNSNRETGIVLRIYTPYGIYRTEQTGNEIDYVFTTIEQVWEFDYEYLFVWKLKGRPVIKHGKTVYQSYFNPAIPGLNSAIIDASTLSIGKITSAFPEKWEYVDDCDMDGCNNGMIYDPVSNGNITCHACNGSGQKTRSSALTVRQIPYPKDAEVLAKNTRKDAIQIPPAGYIEKSQVDNMLKFLRDEVQTQIIEAFSMINMEVSNSNVKGEDTALGKMIDRDEQFTFLMQIAYELFDLYEKSINAIGILRYGDKWEGVELSVPTNFNIRTDAEITQEIKTAKESGLPSIVIDNLIKQYVNIRFGNIESSNKISELVIFADRIYSLNSQEIAMRVATNTVAPWEVILHDSITSFIELQLMQNQDFLELPLNEQAALLNQMAQDKAASIAPTRINPEDLLT